MYLNNVHLMLDRIVDIQKEQQKLMADNQMSKQLAQFLYNIDEKFKNSNNIALI